MLVAIGTMGILFSMAVVGLGTLAPQFDLDNAARRVAMVLSQGRVQAITRGHRIVVSFGEGEATITDDTDGVEMATETFPPHIYVSASGDTTFTPVGTATTPVSVTVSNGSSSREITVGLIGGVQIQ